MTRERGELSDEEEALLGIVRPSIEEEEEAERLVREKLAFRRAFLANLMESEDFRDWLWDILTKTGAFNYPLAHANGFPDPLATQFALGRKSAGEDIWLFFDTLTPDLAALMRREHAPKGDEAPIPQRPQRAPRAARPAVEPRLVGRLPGEEDEA